MVLSDLDTRLLKESILGLCREAVANTLRLEVDGIICLTINDQDHVVKIHKFFHKPYNPENQPNETSCAAKSVACENVHERRKAPTTYDNANKNISDRIKIEVDDVLIQPEPETQGNANPDIKQEEDNMIGTSLQEQMSTTQTFPAIRTFPGRPALEERYKSSTITQDNAEMDILKKIKIETDDILIKSEPDTDENTNNAIQQEYYSRKGTSLEEPKFTAQVSPDIRTLAAPSYLEERCETSGTTQYNDEMHI
ncbi:uncharacterized protein LOC132725781 [Ruditapes philippinarum]|uniref:uncharacterized protein LOC132725781 n=1 Tax=Ruditapes philippinarum TaxID=129788 RepID=UPI00295BF06F|nr:uncharacterized protein LOC132725781 [Ruditapes philippinarum]